MTYTPIPLGVEIGFVLISDAKVQQMFDTCKFFTNFFVIFLKYHIFVMCSLQKVGTITPYTLL